MMSSPYSPFRDGPWRHLADRDVWHSLTVSALAVVFSAGLLWVYFFVRTLSLAYGAPLRPRSADTLLLFGKRLTGETVDTDYASRLERLCQLVAERPYALLLLGGHTGAGLSEAAAALAWLREHGLPQDADVRCEDASTDTLENLRNARDLIGTSARVALISSRYHLPRCLLLAQSLGFDAEIVAAEPGLRLTPGLLARLALEASYCLWLDVGRRWARLIGHQRMVDRVT
ncbi:MAG: YdcF family protein [Rhodanobacteraceae bacterium]|nr:YdcF family protein [Rhodanobacteraceae bacterium]